MSKAKFPGGATKEASAADAGALADRWHKRASRHYLDGDLSAAVAGARRCLLLDPRHGAPTAMIAFACQRLGSLAPARTAAARAVVLAPGQASFWRLRGAIDYVLGRREAAMLAGRRAVLLDPADQAAAYNLFTYEREAGRWERAIAAGRRACVLAPDSDSSAFELGMLLLALGRWAEGWPLYDRRLRLPRAAPRPDRLPQPYWDGRPDADLTVAIWCDQNVGDEMQFARLLPEAAARVGRVVLECDPRLVPLFARSFPAVTVVGRADPPDPRLTAPDVGAQLPQGHLGRLLRQDAASFGRGPRTWLAADPDRTAVLRARYRDWSAGRPVVGIAWKSVNAAFQGKNLPLADWAPVLRTEGALFLSVQYGDAAADLAAAEATGVAVARDPEVDALVDLDGFAAQLAAVDLVISISNSTIHQASGLGRPVWGLLHVRPDWRWGVAGPDCPWFPSLRLYRQPERGAWEPVLAAVAGDLRRWLADRPGAC